MADAWSASRSPTAPTRTRRRAQPRAPIAAGSSRRSAPALAAAGFSCPSSPKSPPPATRDPSIATSFAGNSPPSATNVPAASQYPADRNAIRARSRSTTRRVATDCTRPADSPDSTFFHRTGRDLEAEQSVHQAASLLRVDEVLVEVAGVGRGLVDRVAGDLVEHHPADRHLRLEHLAQVPGDRLTLAVLVRREPQLICRGQRLLQLGDLGPLARA